MKITALEMSKKIMVCYDSLPNLNLCYGAAENSDVAIVEFNKERMKIATDCVFAEFGINRGTSERR